MAIQEKCGKLWPLQEFLVSENDCAPRCREEARDWVYNGMNKRGTHGAPTALCLRTVS